jgi:predicted phosphodiesterase
VVKEITPENNYDDLELKIETDKNYIKVLQLTDVHLTYWYDSYDRKTINLIDDLLDKDINLIIITGDITLSIFEVFLINKFGKYIDSLNIPWTISWGNHDSYFSNRKKETEALLSENYKNIIFSKGSDLGPESGIGNFRIKTYLNNKLFFNFYLLDSNVIPEDKSLEYTSNYGYFSPRQVSWYQNLASKDLVSSMMVMHIPLYEYESGTIIKGEINEPVCYQGLDTGIFQVIKNETLTKYVIAGHDHTNDAIIEEDGIYLIYGKSTGYNGYGNTKKGVRYFLIYENYLATYTSDLTNKVMDYYETK